MSVPCILKFVKILPEARIPFKGSKNAAGFDLRSAINYEIKPNETALIDTGLKFEFPTGCYGRLASRSSIALQKIDVKAGVIDPDYRGHLQILMHNYGTTSFKIRIGDRIAQMICEKFCSPILQEIDLNELSITTRGCEGFGSSGIN